LLALELARGVGTLAWELAYELAVQLARELAYLLALELARGSDTVLGDVLALV